MTITILKVLQTPTGYDIQISPFTFWWFVLLIFLALVGAIANGYMDSKK